MSLILCWGIMQKGKGQANILLGVKYRLRRKEVLDSVS
jgi:hypothetical protein